MRKVLLLPLGKSGGSSRRAITQGAPPSPVPGMVTASCLRCEVLFRGGAGNLTFTEFLVDKQQHVVISSENRRVEKCHITKVGVE
jgi:hypothetical protein